MQELRGIVSPIPSDDCISPRILSAAQEFEGQIMKELLTSLSGGVGGEESEESSDSWSAIGAFGTEALGRSLSARGGFGIAREVIQGLSQNGLRSDSAQIRAELQK